MRPVTQSRVGNDGTCFRSCLASILEVQEDEVPDFQDANLDPGVNQFLHKRGLHYSRRPIDDDPPSGWHTIEGISPRGGMHAVVGHNGKFQHDPHPQDGTGRGLKQPMFWGALEPLSQRRSRLHKTLDAIMEGGQAKPPKPPKVYTSNRHSLSPADRARTRELYGESAIYRKAKNGNVY